MLRRMRWTLDLIGSGGGSNWRITILLIQLCLVHTTACYDKVFRGSSDPAPLMAPTTSFGVRPSTANGTRTNAKYRADSSTPGAPHPPRSNLPSTTLSRGRMLSASILPTVLCPSLVDAVTHCVPRATSSWIFHSYPSRALTLGSSTFTNEPPPLHPLAGRHAPAGLSSGNGCVFSPASGASPPSPPLIDLFTFLTIPSIARPTRPPFFCPYPAKRPFSSPCGTSGRITYLTLFLSGGPYP